MTVFFCDGFEAYGDTTSTGADIQALIQATNDTTFNEVSGGHGGDVSLINDFETVGFALEFPDFDSARAEYVTYENPDGTGRFADYQVATDASAPVLCVGFRIYNADWTVASGTITTTIFQAMNSSSGSAFSVQILNDKEQLRVVDNDALTYDSGSVLSLDTWHYVEVEWKQTTSANGGYCKVYLDGNEVIDTGAADMAGFTFFSTFGFRVGCGISGGNQTGGSNYAIDDVYCMEIDGVDHTAPLGSVRVLAMRPTSDATPNDWTPSTGSDNYALVDDTDVDETDYVDATTTGDDDHFGLSALENVSTVHCARVDVACVAVDGTPTLHIGFDDGTADEQSMGVVATGSTQNFQQTFEEDPSNAAWTESAIEAIEMTMRMTE